MNLFTYGTLAFPEVLEALLGRLPESEPARLAGYACRRVQGEIYPAIVEDPGADTSGRLYHDLDAGALAVLDAFEGALYRRSPVRVTLEPGDDVEAEAYVIAPENTGRLSAETWNRDDFESRHKESFVRICRAFGASFSG